MPQLVNRKVFLSAQTGQTIVRQGTGPHQFTHGFIIAGIGNSSTAVCNHCAQQRLGKCIRYLIINRIKIAIQRMHHNVRNAAGYLIDRKGTGQFRIHNSKFRPVQRGA